MVKHFFVTLGEMAKGATNAPKVLWGAYRQPPPYHNERVWYALVGQGMVILLNNQQTKLYVVGIGRFEDTDVPLDANGLFKVDIATSWVQTYVQNQTHLGEEMEEAHLYPKVSWFLRRTPPTTAPTLSLPSMASFSPTHTRSHS